MILKKLREETTQFHKIAEQLNFSQELSNKSITKEDYGILLKRLYLFFLQLAMLESFNDSNFFPDEFFMEKACLLNLDISDNGKGFVDNQHCFKKVSYFQYLGFCYVAVGSMLGGSTIFQNLKTTEHETNKKFPTQFYESCAESASIHWKPFTQFLQTIKESDQNELINGAKTAYLYFIYLCTIIKSHNYTNTDLSKLDFSGTDFLTKQ